MKITIELDCWDQGSDISDYYQGKVESERDDDLRELANKCDLPVGWSNTSVTVELKEVTESFVDLMEGLQALEEYYSTPEAYKAAIKARQEDLAEFLLEEQRNEYCYYEN